MKQYKARQARYWGIKKPKAPASRGQRKLLTELGFKDYHKMIRLDAHLMIDRLRKQKTKYRNEIQEVVHRINNPDKDV